MNLPHIVIPAAGNSKRFKDVGINTPKGLIDFTYMSGVSKPMIQHVVPYDCENYTIVTNDQAFADKQFAYPKGNVMLIKSSEGQAHTVHQFCDKMPDQPILVLNSDAWLDYPMSVFCDQCRWADVGVLVFEGHRNTAFSYVDNLPIFKRAKEKYPLSRWAIAGGYWFRSSRQLASVVEDQLLGNYSHAGEFYLSATLSLYKGEKLAVVMDEAKIHGWGTPEELARDHNVLVSDTKIETILSRLR